MTTCFNLGKLDWTLTGWTPYVWQQAISIESGVAAGAEAPPIPAHVPGSVQGALRTAGIIPDWNVALNARNCEWVENRHWIYTTRLPDTWLSAGRVFTLHALGLDHKGWILVNGASVATFEGSFVPVSLDLTPHLRPEDNILQIVFDCPPRWLGQIGFTSQMREWKARFNYFWDWTARLVQAGIWDDMVLQVSEGDEIGTIDCRTSVDMHTQTGRLRCGARVTGKGGAGVRMALQREGVEVRARDYTLAEFNAGVEWTDLPVELWWPNGEGPQPLYAVTVQLLDDAGHVLDERVLRVGFVSVRWQACEGAPAHADPWICVVNGRAIFMQGVNWTPIRPNFADVTDDQYRHLLWTYRDLGCTMLRIWGGAFFLPTSPSGPNFGADEENFGQGVHWDVHGPWKPQGDVDDTWSRYWQHNDGLFHSEIGAPSASPAALIRGYKGDLAEVPGTVANPLWRRTSWWIEWPEFVEVIGREPLDLEEYVEWSQARQARALEIAATSAKRRFPRCGGFLIWMGHDSFPCTANTSIIDFDGRLKPAAHAVRRVFRGDAR